MVEHLPIGTQLDHPCPECGEPMVLRNSKFGLFYGCSAFPQCRATHGAYPDGRPLGTPADKETKKARIRAHDCFDQLWKKGHMSRGDAYAWMREAMELTAEEAHIGRFDVDKCDRLELLVDAYLENKDNL